MQQKSLISIHNVNNKQFNLTYISLKCLFFKKKIDVIKFLENLLT